MFETKEKTKQMSPGHITHRNSQAQEDWFKTVGSIDMYYMILHVCANKIEEDIGEDKSE